MSQNAGQISKELKRSGFCVTIPVKGFKFATRTKNIFDMSENNTPQSNLTPEELHKKKTITGILAILFGCFGIHYFLISKPIPGIITLVVDLLTCFIPGAILGLISGIKMLTGSEEDFKTNYLETKKDFPI